MLPKTSAYVKSYDGQNKWMYYLIEDNDLLKKYNTIWEYSKIPLIRPPPYIIHPEYTPLKYVTELTTPI